MANNLQHLAYSHSGPRISRRTLLIVTIALAAVLLGYGLWRFIKPHIDQQRYLADEQRLHAFFHPPDSVIQSTDPGIIQSFLGPELTSQRIYSYRQNPDKSIASIDRLHRFFGDPAFRPGAFCCLMRSPGGTERIVHLWTQTFLKWPVPSNLPWDIEVIFMGHIRTPSTNQPGNRGAVQGHYPAGRNDMARLKREDRLTIYAGVRSADERSVTLPYRLNDQPGEFLITLNDDGSVTIAVKSGDAKLVK